MINIELPHNWNPRPDQMALFNYMQTKHAELLKDLEEKGTTDVLIRAVEVAHRRWGKDDVALHFTACAAMQRVGNYWHMLPQYAQARKAIWTAINPHSGIKRIDEAFPLEIRYKTLEHEMEIILKHPTKPGEPGSNWKLVGSDNYNAYMGSPPIGIVQSEYSISNPMAWGFIMPIVEENKGWALFIYTSRGRNHGKTMYETAKHDPLWFSELLTADQSPVFVADQLIRIKAEYIRQFGPELGEALFLQEYYCSFEGAQLGAYYSKQLAIAEREGRICDVPHDTRFPVYLFFDLGVDDSTTIWFVQQIGPRYHVIDYYESMGEGIGHYAKIVKEKRYNYGDAYMPHDGDARKLAETAETPREIFMRLTNINVEIVERPNDIMAVLRGVEAGRNIIGLCWFDKNRCAQGLSALESYAADYDEDKKKLSNKPKHNWASHGADGWRTFAVGYVGPAPTALTADEVMYGK